MDQKMDFLFKKSFSCILTFLKPRARRRILGHKIFNLIILSVAISYRVLFCILRANYLVLRNAKLTSFNYDSELRIT